MLEKEVESAIVRYAEERGVIAIKLNGPHDAGKPDRVFFYNGRALIVEMKKPGEKPTRIQQAWLDKFTALGFRAICCDNIGKGKTEIDRFIERTDAEHSFIGKIRAFISKFRKIRWGNDGDCTSAFMVECLESDLDAVHPNPDLDDL